MLRTKRGREACSREPGEAGSMKCAGLKPN